MSHREGELSSAEVVVPQRDKMSIAARNGDIDGVKQLLLDAPPIPHSALHHLDDQDVPESAAAALVRTPDTQGYTPLHWAALHDKVEIVRLLLKSGALPNQAPQTTTGMLSLPFPSLLFLRLLHFLPFFLFLPISNRVLCHILDYRIYFELCCLTNCGTRLIFIHYGAGQTPLHWAAINGNVAVMSILVDHGGEPGTGKTYCWDEKRVEMGAAMARREWKRGRRREG